MTPYLSVIGVSRNDEHGGNLLARTQIFVEAWINQAKRHNLSSELILVEWNPPAGRERLAKALRWPADTGPCKVRIIEVPAEIHARYKHGDNLPLYQMIGKNAGIRRARGEFLLLTNIDIVFSNELVQFLASRRLEKGRMYRIDRTDVMADVPVDGTLDEQLAYCRSHALRLFTREGYSPLNPDGSRQSLPDDITGAESGIHFGRGWFPLDRSESGEAFRWIGDEAEMLVRVPAGGAVLELELEPGPGVAALERGPHTIEVLDWNGSHVASWRIAGRTTLHLVLPTPPNHGVQSIWLRVPDGGLGLVHEHRILNFQVFRCDWAGLATWDAPATSTLATIRRYRPTLLRMLAARQSRSALTVFRQAVRLLRRRANDVFTIGMEGRLGQGWYGLDEAVGERSRWAGQDAEMIVRVGGSRSLAMLVEPGPSVGFGPLILTIRTAGGQVVGSARIHGVTYVEVPLPVESGAIATLVLSSEEGRPPTGEDPRILNFRMFACGEGSSNAMEIPALEPDQWAALTVSSRPPGNDWASILQDRREQIAEMGKPAFLHTFACGDFTMMAREHWFDVRGYVEFDGYSMHMDSMLCYAAHYAGAPEELLLPPMQVYHIEHGIGSGWSPEGETHLFTRLARKGISWVSNHDMEELIAHMRTRHAPVIFNRDDWGLVNDRLPEIEPAAQEVSGMAGSKV
jgi:hypothetical protein